MKGNLKNKEFLDIKNMKANKKLNNQAKRLIESKKK